MNPAVLFGLCIAAGATAAALHEFTHYAAASLLGRNPSIDWTAFDTVWPVNEGFEQRDRIILLAPVLVGLCLLPVLLYWYWVPADLWLPATVGYVMYTLGGLVDDIPGGLGLRNPTKDA